MAGACLHSCLSMKLKYVKGFLTLALCLGLWNCSSSEESRVLPQPNAMTYGKGSFDASLLEREPARFRQTLLEGITAAEGYRLRVTRDSIVLEAADEAGLFYGQQTLRQLQRDNGRIPVVTVEDAPRFAWRGFMMDVSRHFYDTAFLKKQIDAMAALKMNRLHLHLTDAAGWRIEIKAYPRLTGFAAWRTAPLWKDWWFGSRTYAEEGSPDAFGGYYTQQELRELVAYAAERHIQIIPEIEMPAHSEEVLAAYPELSCSGEPYKHPDFCPGREETFTFLQTVLDEVMDIFPSEYIHVGGDEAGKAAWKTCARCQARMKQEGLESVEELQSYLIRRMGAYLASKGRRLLGWDEILQGGLAPGATVMSWRGIEGGLEAVKAGETAILTPGSHCYFDTYQDAPHTLPEAMGGYLPLEKVYSFEPIPDTLKADEAARILGVQANLWCEYVPTVEHAEMMIYPRLFALAEVAWTQPEQKNWPDFHRRALVWCAAFEEADYHPFDLAHEFGNRPEALTDIDHLAKGKPVTYHLPYYPGYAAGGDAALTDGKRGGWTYGDGRWQGFIRRGRLDVTIDLGESMPLSSISADFMQVCGPEVFLPARVVISVSDDNENFTELVVHEHEVVRDSEVRFVPYTWTGTAQGRYVRYQAQSGAFGGFVFTDEIVVK